MGEFCKVERDGRLLIVTLNRPEKLNSLHAPACFELDAIWNDFEADPELWVAIITGEGRAFCAGHDLADAPDERMPKSGWAGLSQRTTLNKPIIAAVNGVAFGGGFEIALSSDIVIADEKAKFALSEPLVGAVAMGGGAARLGLRIPMPIAMGMLLTGRRIDAEEAHRWGLVTDIAPEGTAMEVARRWAEQILQCSPHAVRFTKQIALAALEGEELPALIGRMEDEILPQVFKLEDTHEGIAAFMEKRKPVWKGR